MDLLKTLLKQRFSIVALFLGAALLALPYIQIDKENHLTTHPRTSVIPIVVGITLIIMAGVALFLSLWMKHMAKDSAAGLDMSKVKERSGELLTCVGGCEIRVVEGAGGQEAEPSLRRA